MSHLRKIIALCTLLTISFTAMSQVVVYSEDFENGGAPPVGWTTSNTSGSTTQNWGIGDRLQTGLGTYSDSAAAYSLDTLMLTSGTFSAAGYAFVTLKFDHICDLASGDTARIEVRGGTGPWRLISKAANYEGLPPPPTSTGAFWGASGAAQGFNQNTYRSDWGAFNNIPNPERPVANTDWQTELFDISEIADSANCQIRFRTDGDNIGASPNTTAWFLDNIEVTADVCETFPPVGNLIAPIIANKSTVNSLGPFGIKADIFDKHSGVDSVFIRYLVKGVWYTDTMTNTTGNVWEGEIRKQYGPLPVDTFVFGDSVCYYVEAIDKSVPCANTLILPPPTPTDACWLFRLKRGEPLPYCDGFDVNNLWTASLVPNTIWEKGNPTPGGHGPRSAPNSWVTTLAGDYANNIDSAFLYSPIFDFGSAITPRISFWQNRQMAADNDLLALEYSINKGPWTRLGVKNDPAGVRLNAPFCPSTWNTSTTASVNGWNGNSGGWVQSFYQLPSFFNSVGGVQFRFRFFSGAGGNGYGVAIDDFCIENPPADDLSSLLILAPGDYEANLNNEAFLKPVGSQDSVTVVFRNTGTNTLTSVPARYILNAQTGTTVFNETFTYPRTFNGNLKASLAPLESDTFTFAAKFTVPKNDFFITAVPTLPGDADVTNDTMITKGHFGFITTSITHKLEFDGPDTTWSALPMPVGECGNPPVFGGTRWEKGTPNWGATNSAYSAPNSWDINLTSVYTASQREHLYTQFYDLSNWDQAFVSFWQNRNTELAADGFRLEYNVSRTAPNWQPLAAAAPTPDEINWFSGSNISSGTGWSGNSGGWVYSEFKLADLPTLIPTGPAGAQVQFRFVFISDATTSTIDDGVSIDDFRIVNPPLEDLEIVSFVDPPERDCVMDIKEPVEIVVKNVGKIPMDTLIICYEYGVGAGPFTLHCDTVDLAVPLPVGATYSHPMSDSADLSTFNTYTFNGWVSHARDTNLTNDSLFGYEVENVEGCNIEVTVTTGPTIPLGAMMYMIDTTNLPHDTIYSRPMSTIGPNAVQQKFEICMENVGDFKFVITPNVGGHVLFWNLQDLFADTSMGDGTNPTGPAGYGFHWQCPPLLSASSSSIGLTGALTTMPIPQPYKITGFAQNRGSINMRQVEFSVNIHRNYIFSGPPILFQKDTVFYPSPGLKTLQLKDHEFNTTWNAEPGEYTICIWTQLPNGNPDHATHDDTVCLDYTILDTISQSLVTPYCNDFERTTGLNPWGSFSKNIYDTNSTFRRGTPNQTLLNGASSGTNAWMTGLSTDHVILDSSGVYSPMFYIPDTSECYTVSFKHKYKSEYAFDGATVELSIDSGLTWHTVGNIDDTIYQDPPLNSNSNWFNTPYVVGFEGSPHPPGWTGSSGPAFITSSYQFKFPDFGNSATYYAVFRFRFGADASSNDEGWVIDDFCLERVGNCIYWSCFDGRLNQDETDIDCGGVCDPCESCFDGEWNQNETDVDCGGVCPPCPSCVDGIQNGDETNIDCGGTLCAPCGTCNDAIRNYQWEIDPITGVPFKNWEDPIGDCGGPCPPCWVGVDELSEDQFGLGQNIPNPTDGRTLIVYSVPTSGTVNVTIQSMLGQTMYSTTVQGSKGINQLEVDVSDWADGVYYYSFEFNGERLIKKLTVNK